jgi:hypothetical protein
MIMCAVSNRMIGEISINAPIRILGLWDLILLSFPSLPPVFSEPAQKASSLSFPLRLPIRQ